MKRNSELPEFGNDTACDNCGDEWSVLDENNLCDECAQVMKDADK